MNKNIVIKIVFVVLLAISIYFIISGIVGTGGNSPSIIYEENLIVSDINIELTEGETREVTAKVMPSDATYKNVSWYSTNPSVATVDNGLITAISEGLATIKVTTEKMMITKFIQVKVNKKKIPVERIDIENKEIDMYVDDVYEIKYTIVPDDATDKKVSMTSGDTSMLAFTEDGKIVAIKEGDVRVTITCDGVKEDILVHVKPKIIDVTKVSVTPTSVTLDVGKSKELKVTISPSSATNQTVIWTSSKEDVATVDNNGKVSALKEGSTTITATSNNGLKATCKVTVNPQYEKPITDTSFTSFPNIASCSSDTFKYRIINYNGNDFVLIWVLDANKQLNSALAVSDGSRNASAESILQNEISAYGYQNKCLVATNASFFNMSSGSIQANAILNKGKVIRNNGNVTAFGVDKNGFLSEYINKPITDLQKDGVRNTFAHSHRITPKNTKNDSKNRTILCQVNRNNFVLISGSGSPDRLAYDVSSTIGITSCFNLDGGGSRKLYYKTKSGGITKRFGGDRKIPDMLYFTEQ